MAYRVIDAIALLPIKLLWLPLYKRAVSTRVVNSDGRCLRCVLAYAGMSVKITYLKKDLKIR